jgi:hypothetical protein
MVAVKRRVDGFSGSRRCIARTHPQIISPSTNPRQKLCQAISTRLTTNNRYLVDRIQHV